MPCIFQYRYLVAFVLFLDNVFINITKSSLSIAMTAMLNNSHKISSPNVSVIKNDECGFYDLSNVTAGKTYRMEGEFDWSPDVQGYILGGAYLGYSLGLLPFGILTQKFGGEKILTCGIFLYSLGFIVSPFAARIHYALLVVMQIITGIGHSSNASAYAILASNWFPKCERGLFNPIILAGHSVGSIVGSYSAGFIAESNALGGWPAVFYLFGILLFINGIWNKFSMYECPKIHPRIEKAELQFILQNQESDLSMKRPPTPWSKIFTSIPVYATIAGICGHVWLQSHAVSLYAPFAAIVLNFSPSQCGLFTSIYFVLSTFVTLLSGFVPNWLNKRGYIEVNKLRKGCQLIALLGYSAGLVGVILSGCDRNLINIFLICSFTIIGVGYGGAPISPMDMSPTFAGVIMSVCAIFGQAIGFLFPFLVGMITKEEQSLRQWYKIFGLSIGVTTSIGIFYCIFGSSDIQPWNFPEDLDKQNLAENRKNGKIKPEHIPNCPETEMQEVQHL